MISKEFIEFAYGIQTNEDVMFFVSTYPNSLSMYKNWNNNKNIDRTELWKHSEIKEEDIEYMYFDGQNNRYFIPYQDRKKFQDFIVSEDESKIPN